MKLMLAAAFSVIAGVLSSPTVAASGGVVITQVQTGVVSQPTHELVELYNNTDQDIEITDWCIRYSSASSSSVASSPKYCFEPPDELTSVHLRSYSHALIATSGYVITAPVVVDGLFSGSGMSAMGGHIWVLGSDGQIKDMVGWGAAIYSEGYSPLTPAPLAPSTTQSLLRHSAVSSSVLVYQDTDNNFVDFLRSSVSQIRGGGVFEERRIVDICPVIEGVQEEMPLGYGWDDGGDCAALSEDMCGNIEHVQLEIPSGMMRDADMNCHDDLCSNLEGLQTRIPDGYGVTTGSYECVHLENRSIFISEILPNANGVDTGKEFIELFNPNHESINLGGYVLAVGKNLEELVPLPGVLISPFEYVAFSDTDLKIALLNTENRLALRAPAGNIVSETFYVNAPEDESWSVFDKHWAYTDQTTRGELNLPRFIERADDNPSAVSGYVACGSGKYRHPITNRCRNIEADTRMLVACGPDEYRNPETNRCRKAAVLAATMAPCREGYERNPATNRCRKSTIASSGLTPCKEGYERNPATNRCRKSSQTAGAIVASAPVQLGSSSNHSRSMMLAAAGVAAAGYGLYEWRMELGSALRRLLRRSS